MLDSNLIGERFSELRNSSGFTESQLAEYLEVDQSYISECEKNERSFSLDRLEKAADLFGCPVDYFVNESCEIDDFPMTIKPKSLRKEDLNAIAAINKISINLSLMEDLLEG